MTSDTFCIMPHIALAMQNNGDISVCNICKTSLHVDGQPSTIDKNNIKEFWNSITRKEIINELDNNKKHHGCNSCFEKEFTGNKSARQEFNELFKNLEVKEDPQILIIKPGNTCNSACRTCVPETSSSLYSDYYKLHLEKNPDVKYRDYIKKFEIIRQSFSESNPNFWPAITDWYKTLHYMDVYGGEPWLIPGLWKSLQQAVEQGFANNITLQFHTNAMTWREDYMKLLTNFKNVRIGFSIDSHIDSQFNYIRHKSNYQTVSENCFKFIDFIKSYENLSCYISITPSILNIFDLDKTVEMLKTKFNIDVGFTNYVHEPKHYDIRHLPREVKKIIIEKFKNTELEKVSNYMNSPIQGCEIYWPKFCMQTDKFDRIREQSFAKTFPEWFNILQPYWDYKTRHKDWYGTV